MSSADSIIRAIRIGKKATREMHEVGRAMHHGQTDDAQTAWTEHPNIKNARAHTISNIVDAGPQRRGGREIQ